MEEIVSHFRQLLKDPQVIFAGYRVPHPLEHKFVLRVQTTSDYSPHEAFTNALTDLMSEVSLLEERLKVMLNQAILQTCTTCLIVPICGKFHTKKRNRSFWHHSFGTIVTAQLQPLLDWFKDNYVGRPMRRGNERHPL